MSEAILAREVRQYAILDESGKPVASLTAFLPILAEGEPPCCSATFDGATYQLTVQVPVTRGEQAGSATLQAELTATGLWDALRQSLPLARRLVAQGVAEATARGFSASVGGIIVAGSGEKVH